MLRWHWSSDEKLLSIKVRKIYYGPIRPGDDWIYKNINKHSARTVIGAKCTVIEVIGARVCTHRKFQSGKRLQFGAAASYDSGQ